MRDITVVICAYTEARWDELVASVRSILNQTRPACRIVVVIDYNPTLLERVKACIPEVLVTRNDEKRGLAGARNSGIKAAAGDVIAFMDEDALAAPDWLEQLNSGYDNEDVIGVGGAIEPMWLEQRPDWFPREFDWVVGCTYLGMPETNAPVRNLIGCNMSFRRDLFAKVGGFRNGIGRIGTRPIGCEETEFCIRAAHAYPDSRILYMPTARVHHRVPSNRAQWSYFRARCYSEGLSKALIARFVGAKDSLTAEQAYTFRVLPRGGIRGLADTMLRRDPAGALRAGAIFGGLMFTTWGYVRGRLASSSVNPTQASNALPAAGGHKALE